MGMEFISPQYLSEACEILDQRGAELKICAGMTHLLRFYPRFPEEIREKFKGVLHVGRLQALSECREEAGRYVIGATTPIAGLITDPYIGRYASALVDAAYSTSTPQVRNRRTVGGEIAWGSYHSPLITTLLALDAHIRIRLRGQNGAPGHEENLELNQFYIGKQTRISKSGRTVLNREPKTQGQNLILKIILSEENLHRPGSFSFFRSLTPKLSTENSGVVIAVSGVVQNGVIQSARIVASGFWIWTLQERLPIEGIRMSDPMLFEKLHSWCDRYGLEPYRREGPSAGQLGLVIFGLLKEGFSGLLGR
jgi:CO/xanthine dehydrogenase FAD-binding subunit